MRSEPLDRLDLDPGLLAELARGARRAAPRPPRGTRRGGPSGRAAARSLAARAAPWPSRSSTPCDRGRRVRPVLASRRPGTRRGRCSRARALRRSAGRAASRREVPSAGYGLTRASASSTASASRGHASFAQSPKSRSVRHASASAGLRVDPEERRRCAPKWPNVRGELRAPVQCGAFASLELDAEAPVVRLHPPEARAARRRGPGTGRWRPRRASRARRAAARAARAQP